jgi:hypothetical protein
MNIVVSVIKDNENAEYCGQLSITPSNSELLCKYHLVNQTQSGKILSGDFISNHQSLSSIIGKLEEIVNSN